jgi:hypothetical protein
MAKAIQRPASSAAASNALFVYVFGTLIIALAIGQSVVSLLSSVRPAVKVRRELAPVALQDVAVAAPRQRNVLGEYINSVPVDGAALRGATAASAWPDVLDISKPLPLLADPWPFGDTRERLYPVFRSRETEESVPISAVNARAALEVGGVAPPSKGEPGPASHSLTTGESCWGKNAEELFSLGLDDMADGARDMPVPQGIRRSRVRHVGAEAVASLTCSWHSAPIGGGMQCCCSGAEAIIPPPADAKVAPPGPFFCLPSLLITGPRHAGVGIAWAYINDHKYLAADPKAALAHAYLGVTVWQATDGVLPRLALNMGAHAATMGAETTDGAATGEAAKLRIKSVGARFFADVSVPSFHALHAITTLRHMYPRTRVVLVLRDPVERAYADIVRTLVEEGDGSGQAEGEEAGAAVTAVRAARPALLSLLHTCARAVACSGEEGAGGGEGVHGDHEGTGGHGHGHGTEEGSDVHGSALDPDQWEGHAKGALAACVSAGLQGAPSSSPLSWLHAALAKEEAVEATATCMSGDMGPGAGADWSIAYKRWLSIASAYGEVQPFAPCPSGPSSSAAFLAESAAVWSTLPYTHVRALLGCVPPVLRGLAARSPSSWPGRSAWEPSEGDVLAAIVKARAGLAACSRTMLPGAVMPRLGDLVAKANADREVTINLMLEAMPLDAPVAGATLVEGGEPGADGVPCFPDGTDMPGLTAALARSVYLPSLLRVRAVDRYNPSHILSSADIRGGGPRTSAALKPVFGALNVYSVDADSEATARSWAALHVSPASAAWRGEEQEFDLSTAGGDMPPAVRMALEEALDPYTRATAAVFGLPQPPKGQFVEWEALIDAVRNKAINHA